MCKPYYTLTDITGKIDELNGYRKNKEIEKLQDMRYYQTYGQFLAHEMMHLRSTWNPEPEIVDKYLWGGTGEFQNDVRAYGPKRVHQLAQGDASGSETDHGGIVSTVNADSYALLINSIFWWDATQYFPGVPRKAPGSPPPVPTCRSKASTVSSMQSSMRISLATMRTIRPAQDQNACHGISGDYWVMSRDVAVDNVNTFCGQSNSTQYYNTGSVNALELSVQKLEGDGGTPQNAPDCASRFMNAVIDGCDGGDPVNNPHNYKFGSTLTTADGWIYKMKPLSQQVNEVSCDVSYKFFYDGFEIRGKNLPDASFGAEGEGLHSQLSGCGALTSWHFERTPDDCCFQWYASGNLPIGTKACVGRALESAGGSGDGNCHGAGKRDADNIKRWPGYGINSKHVFRDVSTVKRDWISTWPGYGDQGRHVFGNSMNSTSSENSTSIANSTSIGNSTKREANARLRPLADS
ncbi:hypothetical protein MRB53_038386 [Persea americana]|nr:hypothetical protein MRB53_038386 [Persea americana]